MAAAAPIGAAVPRAPAATPAQIEEQAALLGLNARELFARDQLLASGVEYVHWLAQTFGWLSLETQDVIIPRILPEPGLWRLRINVLSDLYFRNAVKRWFNEGAADAEVTRTQWMATAVPVIQGLLRAQQDWPQRTVAQDLIQSFKAFIQYTTRTFFWLFKTVILTAREDGLDNINWRDLFDDTAPQEYRNWATLNTLEIQLSLPITVVDPATVLPSAEVLVQQANELLARLPGAADEYLEWWQNVTTNVVLETQAVLLPQLLPKPGKWQMGTIASSGRGVPWQAIEEAYFSNAVDRWFKDAVDWKDTARPVIKALLQAPAIPADDIDSQTAMMSNMIRSFSQATDDYEASALVDEYALFYDVASKLAAEEGRLVNWQIVVNGTLPLLFRVARENARDKYPQLDAVLDPLVSTAQELADKAWLRKRRLELAANLAVAPDIPPVEEAQLLIIAIINTPEQKDSVRLGEAYRQLIRDVFRSAEIETQDDILLYLPSPEQLESGREAASLLTVAYARQWYSDMLTALIFDETKPWPTIQDNVIDVIRNGTHLLNYLILENVREDPQTYYQFTLGASVSGLLRTMMANFVSVWWDPNHTFKGIPITFAVFDSIIHWLLQQSVWLAADLNFTPPDPIELRDILLEYRLPPQQREPVYPTFLPLTFAFLQPREIAEEARLRAVAISRAVGGLRQRLVARRRLSSAIPFFLEPSVQPPLPAQPFEVKQELKGLEPLFAPAPVRRRTSTRVIAVPADLPPSAIRAFLAQQGEAERLSRRVITPASSSTEIRSWLAQQEAQEAAFAATLPLIPSATRARWQQGRRTSLATLLAAEPLRPGETTEQEEKRIYQAKKAAGVSILNCERYAHETCSNSHNIGGVHFCQVPEQFRWGPIAPGKQCYDVREIMQDLARQVTSVPSIPQRAQTFLSYPDRVPIRPNHLQTLLTIAAENRLPVPPEIYLYLAGRELQRAPPSYVASVPRTSRRFQENDPYAVVPLFLEAQEEAISNERRQSIYTERTARRRSSPAAAGTESDEGD